MARISNRRRSDPYQPIQAASRCFGDLLAITDSERNALRSISSTALETAMRTSELLAALLAVPGVLIFQGVLPAGADIPRMPHVISAGRLVVLVESVTWPPGIYHAAEDGRVHCDGVYIGQSVRPLLSAVSYWREALPRDHGVSALVIVHRTADGRLVLPSASPGDMTWASAGEAVRIARLALSAERGRASAETLGALQRAVGERATRNGHR